MVPTGVGANRNYVLPVLTLGLNQAASLTRITRASVLTSAAGLHAHRASQRLRESCSCSGTSEECPDSVVTVIGPVLGLSHVGCVV